MPNHLFTITFGDYEFVLDRLALTYRLVETKTGTVWADSLSVGWIEREEVETGTRTRHDFSECKFFSVSEKAGAQGKRILLGLDLFGIPIDLYFTCTEREIQLTVEASRDTRTHLVQDICLLPGLCSVPADDASFLVYPAETSAILFARDAPPEEVILPIWDTGRGLTMPFCGAVRAIPSGSCSALGLYTDSAYGALHVRPGSDAGVTAELRYQHDPERRRLDVRLIPLPEGDYVSIARAYRERIVGEKSHVTLRKKQRERPVIDSLIGGPLCLFPAGTNFGELVQTVRALQQEAGVANGACLLTGWHDEAFPAPVLHRLCEELKQIGFPCLLGYDPSAARDAERESLPAVREHYGADGFLLNIAQEGLQDDTSPSHRQSRWEEMDRRLDRLAVVHEHFGIAGSRELGDWSAIATDFWLQGTSRQPLPGTPVPLAAVVYHDSVVTFAGRGLDARYPERFLNQLLHLSPPTYVFNQTERSDTDYIARTYAVLAPLHRLTFPAFLTAHRFLTADYTVEEAVYSDRTRVVINRSATEGFEDDTLSLPPLGFYVRHPQREAHDALRVGTQNYANRAWRILHSQEGQPLDTARPIQEQEFPL